MNSRLKIRLAAFALAIVAAALVMGRAAQTTWRQVEALRVKLTSSQVSSFQAADQFRADLGDLSYLLLRHEIRPEPSDQEQFDNDWKKLNRWIDQTKPKLTSTPEAQIFNEIDQAYDDYHDAATRLLAQPPPGAASAESSLVRFESVERNSQRLLKLVYRFDAAQDQSLIHFLGESQWSLGNLRALIFAALFVLLLLCAWLATVVYREMIAPLKIKLVESRALIERHEKLASLGMLAAGVAHEIRNPLTAIKARLFTQQKLLAAGSPEYHDSVVIGGEITRLERIVKDFLLFARPSEPRFTRTSADDLLREVQGLLQQQMLAARIRLSLEPQPDALIDVDLAQMKQVLINLVQNAADSIGHDGSITLRARLNHQRLHDNTLDVVVLEVIDSGRGMTPEVQKRLFDPFFTTKEAGTGLGLSIAARIVEKHRGALQYQTEVHHGTTFGIVLPRAALNESQNSAH